LEYLAGNLILRNTFKIKYKLAALLLN